MRSAGIALGTNEKAHSQTLRQKNQQATARAVAYLAQLSNSGVPGWSDFPTNRSGESTSWVTAHVLSQVGTLLPLSLSQPIFDALLTQRHEDGGWGFSESVPSDCDSTLHVLGAILTLDVSRVDVSRSIEFVLSHQTEEGGFSTYKNGFSLIRYRGDCDDAGYEGWTQPHVCVTAVALEVLSRFPRFVARGVLDRAIGFVLDSQTSEGYWESYWWRSKYFSTARLISYLTSVPNTRAKAARNRALDWILHKADISGYRDNGYDLGNPCPLSTSKGVEALLGADPDRREALDGVAWLLKNQNEDGSWTGAPVLQIPPPDVTRPSEIDNWRIAGRGVGACCVDERRIYTTAAVAAALSKL